VPADELHIGCDLSGRYQSGRKVGKESVGVLNDGGEGAVLDVVDCADNGTCNI
jgi:hypothetical protein